MKRIRKIHLLALSISAMFWSLCSCTNYLEIDKYIYDLSTLDSAFNSKDHLIQFVNGTASYLPDEATHYYENRVGEVWKSSLPFQGASDETFPSWDDAAHKFMPFLLGTETVYTENANFYWAWYRGIRAANTILARIGEVPELTDIDKRTYSGEAYFLRGYYYFLLLQQYGPIPLLPATVLDINDSPQALLFERNTYDQCVEAICADMELAANFLPQETDLSRPYRPSAGAALSIIARVRLSAASPWYNGNSRYSGWKRTDGSHFISQTNDNQKWAQAAAAAFRVIESGKYSIYTYKKQPDSPVLDPTVSALNFPDGAGGIDVFRSYSYLFNGEAPLMINTESIWAQDMAQCGDQYTPKDCTPDFLGGHNSVSLTQGAVDLFRRADGTDPKTNSSSPYYVPNAELADRIDVNKEFAGYTLTANAPKMYNNLEMRFYASVGFCHRFWPCTGYQGSENWKNVEVEYYTDGNAYPHVDKKDNMNYTGYTVVKYVNPADSRRGTFFVKSKTYSKIRYAEILLNYAEALNELNQSYVVSENGVEHTFTRDLDEIKTVLNQIRFRSGLAAVTDTDLATQDLAREFIKRERSVEFFCEARRYHDLRRWGDAQDAYEKKITGMDVTKTRSRRVDFFKETLVTTRFAARKFSLKNYFWPIPNSVMIQNNKLVQNPGW